MMVLVADEAQENHPKRLLLYFLSLLTVYFLKICIINYKPGSFLIYLINEIKKHNFIFQC